jgi:16S rRNA (guanine527-N7)-methyltransferase
MTSLTTSRRARTPRFPTATEGPAEPRPAGLPVSRGLEKALREAQEFGWLSRLSLERHVAHALGCCDVVRGCLIDPASEPGAQAHDRFASGDGQTILDLGSGGGLPGLVLAEQLPEARCLLLDGSTKRADWLRGVVVELALEDRVEVIGERAELAAHDPALRASCNVVVARSFGRPGVAAECAAGFLRVGGRFVVSEPPDAPAARWPADKLRALGLDPARGAEERGFHYAVLECVELCDDRYPRRVGIPEKRPLF